MKTKSLISISATLVKNLLEKDSTSLTIFFKDKTFKFVLDRNNQTITVIEDYKDDIVEFPYIIKIPSKEDLEGNHYDNNQTRHFIELRSTIVGFIVSTLEFNLLRGNPIIKIH